MSGTALALILAGFIAACGGSGDSKAPTSAGSFMTPATRQFLTNATRALQEHDFVAAFTFVDSAAAVQPDLADIPFMRGRIYSELARFDVADSLYRGTLAIRADYPGVWHNLGNTAFRQQRYTEAIRNYRLELASHPAADSWSGIGRSFVELGATDSAMSAFSRAIAIDSTLAEAHSSRALLLEDLGDLDGALESALAALRSHPDNPEYRYYVGSFLVRLGRPGEALDYLAKVIEEWPWHQGSNYNMGQALMRIGRRTDAVTFLARAERLRELQAQITHYENTVRVQPTNPFASAGLGTLLRQAGRFNDAVHAYRVALFLDPANLEYRNNLAVLHLLRADTLAAITTFEQIVGADSTRVPTWINLGSLYAMTGDTGRALAAWETALRLHPDNALARASLERLGIRSRR